MLFLQRIFGDYKGEGQDSKLQSSVIPPGTVLQVVSSYALAPHDMLELSIRLLGITRVFPSHAARATNAS